MVGPIAPIRPTPLPEKATPVGTGGTGQFQSFLNSAIEHVENSREAAQVSVEGFLNGGSKDVHSVLLDVQRAELDFELFLQVRNKVTQAYQEIMRMQL